MHPLMLHRACDLGPIRAITASVTATTQGCEVEFRLDGHIPAIILPPPAPPARRDNLWKTTCFEVFWQPLGDTCYREFNLSPSGQWAAYDFDSFRKAIRDAPVEAIAIACSHTDNGMALKASIAAKLPDPAQVALNAIVEHPNGAMQYWAMAFPPGTPEFHSEACRALIIER
ncbi:MAG: hypothetical protein GW858_03775 [Sphingomonadales bacterium]|nr:hypothetical protein [Sphingomonadales bacterium]NCQ20968.1 hypothetical protein [Sphingomonadales bacterium]NCT02726.1 hypothetical protein [Sphingomonadales bacterium]